MSYPETKTSIIWPEDNRKADDHIERVSIMDEESSRLKIFKLQNSAVNNEIIRNEILINLINDNTQRVLVRTKGNKKHKGKVYTICALYYDDDLLKKLKITGETWNLFTGYDRRVYNALCTLWLAEIKKVSLNKIFAVINGYAKSNPALSHLKKIKNAINKLQSIVLKLDITEEYKNNMLNEDILIESGILKSSDIGKDKKIEIEDNIIYLQSEEIIRADKKKYTVMTIIKEPIFLTYNRAKKTLISVPMEYIALKNINATDRIMAIQDYLLMRIINYKKRYMIHNKILYDTMYKNSGIKKPETGKERRRDRNKIHVLMDGWKKEGLIKSYQDIRRGKAYVGILFNAERE